MDALFWFLSGCALTLAACLTASVVRRRRTRAKGKQLRVTPDVGSSAPASKRRYVLSNSRSLEELSALLGADLAGLASGVEGQAQLLCEALGQPDEVAARAEQLWESVRRLRFFSEKIQSFGKVNDLEQSSTNVRLLLAALTLEIEDYSSGSLQVGLQVAPSLPSAMANAEALRVSLLLLIEGVLALEPDSNHLVLQASAEESEDGSLSVRIDIEAILDEEFQHNDRPDPLTQYSCLAARNLLAAQGASFTLDHSPGLNALASITLAATGKPLDAWESDDEDEGDEQTSDPTAVAARRPPTHDRHHFGGVLIMEGNPTIRDMLARELAKTHRNVIACADGMAGRTLFEATPERFEVLILERDSRRLRGEELARIALARDERLRIMMLHPKPGIPPAPGLINHPGLVVLHKPFGLMELRNCLAEVTGGRLAHQPAAESAAHDPS